MYTISEEYTELAMDVIQKHEDLHWILEDGVQVCCLASDKSKKKQNKVVAADCRKVAEIYKDFCPYDYLITVYEPNIARKSEKQMEILMYHELLHIDHDGKLRAHDIDDFKKIIDEYGTDWANS